MLFAILGPLLVHDGNAPVDVPKGRLRVLLAVLLLHAGNPVSADALAEVMWDGSPPPGAAMTLRSHVGRLRRVLGPRAGARLETRHPGYLLAAGQDEVDVLRFRRLCRDGGAARRAGAWARADTLLGQALGLWRGALLADVPSESLRHQEAAGLAELTLQAQEWRADSALHLGRHAELVPGLQSLAAGHPLRERFHYQLMLALYRCGRQAEALAAYQRARDHLIAELGVEPGQDLRELQQRILSADPALAASEPIQPEPAQLHRAVPRELPPAVPGFTGRSAELKALTRLLDQQGERIPGTVLISAIGGTAGAGKTALAVHWAHQVASSFPDGQLYVNLRGYDPGQPMTASDALAGFLHSLGVPGRDIPPEPEQRAARYRSLLADKQMLIILDNARSADQVRPLLPGSPACTVLVTSRDALGGLVARNGATRLDLDLLSLEEAVALLRTLIGARVDAEPAAAADLALQCCRLPLALRVAAEIAATRQTVPLAALTGELADLRTRLDLLDAGADPHTQVRAVLSWSHRHLDAETARIFRLLGLHPGPDVEPYATAALADVTVQQARQALDVLARAHLIQPAAPGRHNMHDLLRGYCHELSTALDTEAEQHAALTRLLDHYLHAAAAAADVLNPVGRQPRSAAPAHDRAAALDWLDCECVTLVAAAGHAAANGWPGHAIQLATTLSGYLRNGGYFAQARIIFGHALGAARHAGDRVAEATILTQIGQLDCQQSRIPQAARHYKQALALYRAAGDRAGEARALRNLGLSETGLGHNERAIANQLQAIAICRDIGDRSGEASAVGNLGLARLRQGRYQEAARDQQRSLDLSRQIGDRECEAWALARLGGVNLRRDRCQQAIGYFRQAQVLFHDMGNRVDETEVIVTLGSVYLRLRRYERAAENFGQALAVFREFGDRLLELQALIGLGDVLLHTGDAGKACEHQATALRLASEIGLPLEQANAHSGLGRVYHATGDLVQARHHWEQALALYAAVGAPELEEIRARLAVIDDRAPAEDASP